MTFDPANGEPRIGPPGRGSSTGLVEISITEGFLALTLMTSPPDCSAPSPPSTGWRRAESNSSQPWFAPSSSRRPLGSTSGQTRCTIRWAGSAPTFWRSPRCCRRHRVCSTSTSARSRRREVYAQNTSIAAAHVQEMVTAAAEARSAVESTINAAFLGAVTRSVMESIQRGDLEAAIGRQDATAYQLLADLIVRQDGNRA